MPAMGTGQVFVHRREQAHHRIARAAAGTRLPIRRIRRSGRRRQRFIRHRRAPITTKVISRAARTPMIGSAMNHLRRTRRSCAAPFATHAAQRSSEPAIDGGIAGEMSVDMRVSPGKSFGEDCRNGGDQKSRSIDHTRSRMHLSVRAIAPARRMPHVHKGIAVPRARSCTSVCEPGVTRMSGLL